MEMPVQITFQGMSHSDPLAHIVRELAAGLARYCDALVACRVTVRASHSRHGISNGLMVRVEVTRASAKFVASREADDLNPCAEPDAAVRDAFDTMRRLLQDDTRKRRAEVKAHAGAERRPP